MKKDNNNLCFWKFATFTLLAALIAIGCLLLLHKQIAFNNLSDSSVNVVSSQVLKHKENGDPLSLWTNTSKLKGELNDYLKRVTDKNSKDFIPVSDRIAVFDFDGTLFCETNPGYLDHRLAYHRIMEDVTYKDKATNYEKQVAAKIKKYFDTGEYDADLSNAHGQCVATSFKGMTIDELNAYIKNFINQPEHNYSNAKIKDMYYQPMVQVIDLLNKNNFKVYVVSGTDRFLTRVFVDGALNIPMRQVIGSDELLKATNQNDVDGLDYQFRTDDDLLIAGEFQIKNLKMNKVKVIEREIGQKPVLAFGNTSGDYSMATFTTSNNKYLSKAFMLCCDDLERENGNLKKAEDMKKHCEEVGWTAISMKNDFVTIYGEDVKYTK